MAYRLPSPEAKPPSLDSGSVPAAVRPFIPLAEKYGIGDDGYREEVVAGLDAEEREELTSFLEESPDELWDWLAGPAPFDPSPGSEYLAFSCLVLAAESAKVKSAKAK